MCNLAARLFSDVGTMRVFRENLEMVYEPRVAKFAAFYEQRCGMPVEVSRRGVFLST